MKEIEIKATLRDKETVMQKLRELGCEFAPAIRQEDAVYAEILEPLDAFLENKVFLRIRVVNGSKVIFTAKQRERGTSLLAALEHEIEVSSADELAHIFAMMGYKLDTRVEKHRITTRYQDREICIDEVEKLGTFIEMEALVKEGETAAIQEEMFVFFETLGISRDDRILVGYDILMRQHIGRA